MDQGIAGHIEQSGWSHEDKIEEGITASLVEAGLRGLRNGSIVSTLDELNAGVWDMLSLLSGPISIDADADGGTEMLMGMIQMLLRTTKMLKATTKMLKATTKMLMGTTRMLMGTMKMHDKEAGGDDERLDWSSQVLRAVAEHIVDSLFISTLAPTIPKSALSSGHENIMKLFVERSVVYGGISPSPPPKVMLGRWEAGGDGALAMVPLEGALGSSRPQSAGSAISRGQSLGPEPQGPFGRSWQGLIHSNNGGRESVEMLFSSCIRAWFQAKVYIQPSRPPHVDLAAALEPLTILSPLLTNNHSYH